MSVWTLGVVATVVVVSVACVFLAWDMLITNVFKSDEREEEWCQWCNANSAKYKMGTEDAACQRCFAEFFEPCPSCGDVVESSTLRVYKGVTHCWQCGPDWEGDDESIHQ